MADGLLVAVMKSGSLESPELVCGTGEAALFTRLIVPDCQDQKTAGRTLHF
jgi:hypothetical protein